MTNEALIQQCIYMLFSDAAILRLQMLSYIENSIDSTKKLLDLISEFGKTVGYKVNIQKSKAYCIPTMKYQKLGGKLSFTIATRKIKYLGINLTKDIKDLYSENNRTLKKEIKKDTNIWKRISCSWTRRINIIKMAILPKATYRFNTIPIKPPMAYFTDIEQTFQKCTWNHK